MAEQGNPNDPSRKQAWVTLATNDSYALGTLVLGSSLRRTGTQYELAVMVTPGVSSHMRSVLETVFNSVIEVNVLDSGDTVNLALLSRPELGITFTKLHCWRLAQYSKCVFLDADTLVLANCDELFERAEFSAAPDSGWPDCFNSGVFVFQPKEETYRNLLDFAISAGSFDGGDQGLLNSFFSGWREAERQFHLPFVYNMVSSATYSYLPAFKAFGGNVKIVHFIGALKPWLMTLDPSGTGQVCPPGGQEHLQPFLQAWWDLFRAEVHPKLRPEMEYGHAETIAESGTIMDQITSAGVEGVDLSIYVSHHDEPPFLVPPNPPPEPEPPQSQSHPTPPPVNPIEHFLDTLGIAIQRFPPEISNHAPPPPHREPQRGPLPPKYENHPPPPPTQEQETHYSPPPKHSEHSPHSPYPAPAPRPAHIPPPPSPKPTPLQRGPLKPLTPPPKPASTTTAYQSQSHLHIAVSSALSVLYSHSDEDVQNSGLAGVYATINFEGPKSPQQSESEDRLRKHAWEQGNIDYLGKDSFDNILKKMQQTMAQAAAAQQLPLPQRKEKSPSPPKPKAKEPTPPPAPAAVSTPAPVEEPTVASTKIPGSQSPIPTEAAVLATEPPQVLQESAPPVTAAAPPAPAVEQMLTAAVVPELASAPPPQVEPKVVAAAPETQSAPPLPTAAAATAPEELEELRLAQERLALEKKLSEQKRVAEQKLAQERAAAETAAASAASVKSTPAAASEAPLSTPPNTGPSPGPKAPARKGTGKAAADPASPSKTTILLIAAGLGLTLIGMILNNYYKS